MYTVQESNMFVYRRGTMNSFEEEDYQMMKRSPYRNYVSGELAPEDQIAFIRVVNTTARIDELEKLLAPLLPENVHMTKRVQPRMENCQGLYFFHRKATIENQKQYLIDYLKEHGEHGIVPVDMVLQDSYTSTREALHLLKKLENIYLQP